MAKSLEIGEDYVRDGPSCGVAAIAFVRFYVRTFRENEGREISTENDQIPRGGKGGCYLCKSSVIPKQELERITRP